MLTPDEIRSIVKCQQPRWQFARAHHRRKDNLASIINSPAGNGDFIDFGSHNSPQKRKNHAPWRQIYMSSVAGEDKSLDSSHRENGPK